MVRPSNLGGVTVVDGDGKLVFQIFREFIEPFTGAPAEKVDVRMNSSFRNVPVALNNGLGQIDEYHVTPPIN